MPRKYRHEKVSGPVKSVFEGLAGMFTIFVVILVFSGGWATAPQALGCGVIAAIFYGIAALIPSKSQYTEK